MQKFSIQRSLAPGLACLALLAGCGQAHQLASSQQSDDKYFTIDQVEVSVKEDPAPDQSILSTLPAQPPAVPIDGIELGTILNVGKAVWKIIEANKPVVNVKTDVASALPKGVDGWESLTGWQTPKSKVYRVQYKNLYKMTVVDFSYRLVYTYGGNVNGKGKYLAHVTMVPANLEVAWGFTFNAEGTVPSVTNAGTKEAPVGGMELMMKWSVDTVFKHQEGSTGYYVKGDGTFSDLTDGNFLKN